LWTSIDVRYSPSGLAQSIAQNSANLREQVLALLGPFRRANSALAQRGRTEGLEQRTDQRNAFPSDWP